MNIDKTLKSLKETLGEPAVDIDAGRERLREAARRLRDDPLEARRIDALAKRIDRYEKDYRLGHEALQRQDYGTAEHHLRRAAEHGNDEAAYWLAVILEMQSARQRLKGRPEKARDLAAEGRQWRLLAQDSGIAEALDQAPTSDTLTQPTTPARPETPRHERAQHADHAPEDLPPTAQEDLPGPPAQKTAPRREDYHAVGIELQPYRFTTVLIDGYGEIIGEEVRNLASMNPNAVVRDLAEATREIVTSALGQGFPADQVALGVQLGGPVDTETGTVHYLCKHPPGSSLRTPFKWEEFALGRRLREETGLPAIVLNDAVAFAEWERWRGVGQETGDFVVMLIREGVGSAVVSGGRHFKGPMEIGQFVTYHDSLSLGDADTLGALESAAGGTAIAAAVGDATGRSINDLQDALDVFNEDITARKAVTAFKSAGVAASAGLAYLVQFAGPSHVVLYAPEGLITAGSPAADAFLSQVTEFRTVVAFAAYRNCELVMRHTETNRGAHGVALAALRRSFQAEPIASSVSTGSPR